MVACGDMLLLRNPSNRELAESIGIRRPLEQAVYDLVVVGAGPAGLAAAVYGASEGLSTVRAGAHGARAARPGAACGSRTTSAFPPASPAASWPTAPSLQANKFGARLSVPTPVTGLTFDNAYAVAAPRRRRDGHGQVPADRHRRRLPPAGRRGLRAVRGQRRLLRRDAQRGAAVPGARTWWSSAAATPPARPPSSSPGRPARCTS